MTDDATKAQIGTMSEELVRWFERAVARAVTVHHGTTGGDFGWALAHLKNGSIVHRRAWGSWGWITQRPADAEHSGPWIGCLRSEDPAGAVWKEWAPKYADIMADDWAVEDDEKWRKGKDDG